MGTLLYVLLRVLGMIDTGKDLINICFLISLDSIGIPMLYRMIRGDN